MPTRTPFSYELPHGFLPWLVFGCFINGTWVTTSHPETYMLGWSGPPQAWYMPSFFSPQQEPYWNTTPLKWMRVELLNLGDLNSLKYLITGVLWGLLLLLLLKQTAEGWLTPGWFWEKLLLIFSLLFYFLFSLTLSFSLFFPLEDYIKEYYHHIEEETKDYEPCTTVFNPRITKHCDLRGEGVGNGVACDSSEGILSGVCFAFSEMGVEGDGARFL
jgi:hypothetical protein